MSTDNSKPKKPSMFLLGKKVIKENKNIKRQVKAQNKFSLWKWFKERCAQYCSVTALHGWNHLVRKDFALWEK